MGSFASSQRSERMVQDGQSAVLAADEVHEEDVTWRDDGSGAEQHFTPGSFDVD